MESKEKESDVLRFKYLIYNLICNKSIEDQDFDKEVDSLVKLESKYIFNTKDSVFKKFKSKNLLKIRDGKRIIFKLGYDKSVH